MRKILFSIIILFTLLGCKKEPTTWDVDALLPLYHSKLTLKQAIPDSLISVGDGGRLDLVYKGTLLEFNLDTVFSIPDTTMEDEFLLPIGQVVLLPGQTFLSDTLVSPYDMKGAQITKMTIGSGIFHVYVSSSMQGELVLDYAIPSATKNGQMFFVREIIPPGTKSNPTTVSKDYDISGYEVDLTGINNNEFNVISTEYRVYADSNGGTVTITAGDKLVMGNTLENILPSYARGYFGMKSIEENSQNQNIDAFNNLLSGTLDLESVTMDFKIENEIGVDVTATIHELKGANTLNNTTVSLWGPIIGNPINLNRSTETGNPQDPITPSVYVTKLDNTNSNVTPFVSNLPHEMTYDIEINLNPLGNVSNSNDFVYDSTGIKMNLEAEIPLKLNAKNLVLVDTSDFALDSTSQEDARNITGGFLNLYAENWFPFSLEGQFYMLDESGQIIDSVFAEPQIISSGIPEGVKVNEPTASLLQAPITGSKIDHLYQTKFMVSKLRINTIGNGKVEIFDNYFVDIKMVGDFTYMISIN